MNTPPPSSRPPRIVVVAEGHLVGEAIQMALQGRDFEVHSLSSPHGRQEINEARKSVARVRASIGLIISEVDDLTQWRDALALIEGVQLRWVVATGSRNAARWGALIASGCQGIVPMSAGLDVLTRSLWSVARGGQGIAPRTRDHALEEWERLGATRRSLMLRISALSPREWEVLEALAEGKSIKAIAERGGVSEGTVRSQVRAIRQKLNVKSQLAAVAAYQQATETSYSQTG